MEPILGLNLNRQSLSGLEPEMLVMGGSDVIASEWELRFQSGTNGPFGAKSDGRCESSVMLYM